MKMTTEQKADNEKGNQEIKEFLEAIVAGKSPCCGAPIDTSRVITSGKWKGHGWRVCSQCQKPLFTI